MNRRFFFLALCYLLGVVLLIAAMSVAGGNGKSLVMTIEFVLAGAGAVLTCGAIVGLALALRHRQWRKGVSFTLCGVLLVLATTAMTYGYRGIRDEIACVRVLHGMFRALTQYAQDHGRRMPESFDALVDAGYIEDCGSSSWRMGKALGDPELTMFHLERLDIVWDIPIDDITEEGIVPARSRPVVLPTNEAGLQWRGLCACLSSDLGQYFHRMRTSRELTDRESGRKWDGAIDTEETDNDWNDGSIQGEVCADLRRCMVGHLLPSGRSDGRSSCVRVAAGEASGYRNQGAWSGTLLLGRWRVRGERANPGLGGYR